MRKQLFGTNTGWLVPVIGQGTWNLPASAAAQQQAIEALKAGVSAGAVHIDTAEMYGSGESEELIARAIAGLPRSNLFIVSKVLPENATYKGTIKACERSLMRLNTDYLDCYLLHWRGSHPLQETMRALEHLVNTGKILSLGVSNFDVDDLKEASGYLERQPIVCNQVLYHLRERGIERHVIPFCNENGIAVVGYTPFGQRAMPPIGSKQGDMLSKIAEKHGCTPRQVVLAFLVRTDNLFAIPKAAKVEHAMENALAGDLVLDSEDIDNMNDAFPKPNRDAPLATL